MDGGRLVFFGRAQRGRSAVSPAVAAWLALIPAACGSFDPTAVTARLDCLGGAVQPMLLPGPDSSVVHPRGLALRIESSLAREDPDFGARLASALRASSVRHYDSMEGVDDKHPHFEICIIEVSASAGPESNDASGVICALSGADVCRRVARSNPWHDLAVALASGDARRVTAIERACQAFVYRVEFRQRTCEGGGALLGLDVEREPEGVMTVGYSDVVRTAAMRAKRSVRSATFDRDANVAKVVRHFGILVTGGVLASDDAYRAEARRVMLDRVPGWLMGSPLEVSVHR